MLYNPNWKQPGDLTATQRLLLDAADLVERRGLAKKTQQDGYGRVCLHGAISIAAVGHPYCWSSRLISNAEYRVANYLRSRGACGALADKPASSDCSDWNNAPDRTQDDVVTALRNAAFHDMTASSLSHLGFAQASP